MAQRFSLGLSDPLESPTILPRYRNSALFCEDTLTSRLKNQEPGTDHGSPDSSSVSIV